MNEFLHRSWWGNPILDYLIVFGVIILFFMLKKIISRVVAGLLFRLLSRVWKNLDREAFTSRIVQPLSTFLLILVSVIALHNLKFPEELNADLYGRSLKNFMIGIGTIVLISSFIWLLLRTIDFIAYILEKKANLTPSQTDNQLVVFFRDFFKVIIFIIGLLMILKFAFGFAISTMLTGLSIIGAAIALALRESLENLIASFIIFFDKPFTVGDLVKVQNITGTIERIGLRSTRLRTDQKTYVSVPNKQMVDSILDNLSLRTQLKAELRLQISTSTTPTQLKELIEEIKKILVRKNVESATVALHDITANAYLVNGDYFTRPVTNLEYLAIKESVNLEVLKLLEERSIELAGAAQDIRIANVKGDHSAA